MTNINNIETPNTAKLPPEADRREALDQIRSIAHRFTLSLDDIIADFKAVDGISPAIHSKFGGSVLTRLLAYLGGILIFAGIGLYTNMQWESMTIWGKLIVTYGAGLALTIMAVLCVIDQRFLRASPPLFLIGILLQGTGILLAFQEWGRGDNETLAVFLTCIILIIQTLAIFSKLKRSTLLFIILFLLGGIYGTFLDLIDISHQEYDVAAIVLGLCYMAICYRLDKTPFQDITPIWYFIGSILLSTGMFSVFYENSYLSVLHLLTASFIIYLGTYLRSRSLLVVGTFSVLAYVIWFSNDHFGGEDWWYLLLIGLGFFMIGLSTFVINLDKKFIQRVIESPNHDPDVPVSLGNP